MSSRPEPQLGLQQSTVEELAAEAAAGSSACFEALVERLGPRLLRYLRRRVGDDHAAEDLLQEAFLKAYRNLGRYDPSRSFSTWLFTIATRLAVSHFRSRRFVASIDAVEPPDAGAGDPFEAAARAEQHENLWARARRVLSDAQFTALWLRYAEEMAIREIADATGRSVTAVKVQLHRACRKLMARGGRTAPAGSPTCAPEGIVETH